MDGSDFEAEYTQSRSRGMTVAVAKVGGGTVGKKYVGNWSVEIEDKSGELAWSSYGELFTGTPTKHAAVAQLAWEYYENERKRHRL